jgi:hypothetical protein
MAGQAQSAENHDRHQADRHQAREQRRKVKHARESARNEVEDYNRL